MREQSRRDFLGCLAPLALVPLTGTEAATAVTRNDVAQAADKANRARTAGVGKVEAVKIDDVPCPNWPLQSLGAITVHGDPQASGKTVYETPDHQITGGVWKCSAGTFDLTFTWDEMALLLEGELIIEESSGRKVRIVAGDFFFVPQGVKTRWVVVKPLKKLFFSREWLQVQKGA